MALYRPINTNNNAKSGNVSYQASVSTHVSLGFRPARVALIRTWTNNQVSQCTYDENISTTQWYVNGNLSNLTDSNNNNTIAIDSDGFTYTSRSDGSFEYFAVKD